MQAQALFREKALNQPSAHRPSDEGLQLVGAGAGLASIAGVAICIAAVLFSVLTFIPIHLDGTGTLLEDSGIGVLTANTSGRVKELHIADGSRVRAGDVLAEVAADDVDAELGDARAALAHAITERASAAMSIERLRVLRAAHLESRAQAAEKLIAREKENLASLKKRHAARAELARDGFYSTLALIDSEQEITASRRRLDELRAPLEAAELEEKTRQSEETQRLLDLEIRIEESSRRVLDLEQHFERTTHVRAIRDGIVAALRVAKGDIVHPDSEIATITPVDQHGKPQHNLVGYMFVPADVGSQIRAGMQAQVVPTSVKPESYGYIKGKVREVSALPQSSDEMMLLLRNRTLVDVILRGGPPVRVDVELERAPTPSTYHWTSSHGPSNQFDHGTELKGRIEVKKERLITIALPFLKRFDQ